MKYRGKNNFYDLDKQIQENNRILYRKLNVALGKSRVECKIKMQNPFIEEKKLQKSSAKFFDNEKTLQKMIYNVQPFWIKKSLKNAKMKNKTLPNP